MTTIDPWLRPVMRDACAMQGFVILLNCSCVPLSPSPALPLEGVPLSTVVVVLQPASAANVATYAASLA
ncbi:MAG: hypothetical protein LJE60_14130 [Thiocapsa sp.]|nr:hypothetical protein [Thiocapsa sp.]